MLFVIIILIPIALALFMVGARFWQATVIGVLFWLLIEGAVRKWLLPSYQAPIILMKDIALIAAYGGYLLSSKARVTEEDKLSFLALLFGTLAVYCTLEMMNPQLPSPLLGLYGLKNYLLYLPLAFVLPAILDTREKVRKAIFWLCIVAIPICLLGLYQFSQPPQSWINKYVSHEGSESMTSLFGAQGEGEFRYGRARTASTFSFIGGFTTFLLLSVPASASVLLLSRRLDRMTILALAALVLGLGATFTTGSRTPIFIFAAAAPLLLLIAGYKRLLPFSAALRMGAAATVVGFASIYLFSDAASALIYRNENSDSNLTRLLSPVVELAKAYSTSPIFGFGVGSNSNAAMTLGGADLYWLGGNLFELETARVMQDLGMVGFILVYLTKIYVIYLIVSYIQWSRSRMFVAILIAILAFVIPHLILFTINNPTGGVIYWGLVGMAIAMHRIERAERREAVAERRAAMMSLSGQQPAAA